MFVDPSRHCLVIINVSRLVSNVNAFHITFKTKMCEQF